MKRVVVTGMGVICSIGNNLDEFGESLRNGVCGVGAIDRFDVSAVKPRVAYLVKRFNLAETLGADILERLDDLEAREMSFVYALAAANEALERSGVDLGAYDRKRVNVCCGASLTGNEFLEEYLRVKGSGEKPDSRLLFYGVGDLHTFISRVYGIEGMGYTVSTACASGSNTIGMGWDLIRAGKSDVVLAGASDCYTRLVHAGFSSLGALDTESIRPFSGKRNGTVLAEGGAFLVLEELESAKRRGATVYAEVRGYAIANDAYHNTASDPSGKGIEIIMESALRASGVDKSSINYVNTHGTGTPSNDATESKAIKNSFKDNLSAVYVNSTKAQVGHMLAAAGAVEAVATVLQIREGYVAPSANVSAEDLIDGDIRFVVGKPERARIDYALSNSYGFGGNNATVCFARYDDGE